MYRNSPEEDYEFYVRKNTNGGYEVSLDHQCDEWKVLDFDATGEVKDFGSKSAVVNGVEVEGSYPAHPKDKQFAVKQMELFVERAQEALEKLKAID